MHRPPSPARRHCMQCHCILYVSPSRLHLNGAVSAKRAHQASSLPSLPSRLPWLQFIHPSQGKPSGHHSLPTVQLDGGMRCKALPLVNSKILVLWPAMRALPKPVSLSLFSSLLLTDRDVQGHKLNYLGRQLGNASHALGTILSRRLTPVYVSALVRPAMSHRPGFILSREMENQSMFTAWFAIFCRIECDRKTTMQALQVLR
ncbi:hypothetical protein LY78DRAFT_274411 [Colletotrichum sublineola]|nr:hypothetical protein LY78DRAFT_274411 [Colletotrichum sublineola]